MQGAKHSRSLRIQRGRSYFIQLIDRGGYGVVYKAKMKSYPYSVRAIKRVKKNSFRNSADLFKEF